MKYFGKITSVSQIDSSVANDGDVFYVGNDKRFIVYDGEAQTWEPFEGGAVELLSYLGNTIATIFTEPLDTSGVVEDITDLPLSDDTPAWTCFRVPKYNVCLVNSDELRGGWLLYVENYGNLKVDDVVDNCESDDPTKPLSANQGRVLFGMIAGVEEELASI